MADKNNLGRFDDLDRLLREELSVEPSSSFAARVRQRVAEQHRTPWWRARWSPAIVSLATLASLAFAVAVPAIARWTSVTVPPAPPAVRLAAVEHPRPELVPELSGAAARDSGGAAPRRAVARREPADRPDTIDSPGLPVVIVDGRQRAALSTLFRMMDQGRVSADSFSATVPVSLEPIAGHVGAITVAPLVVSAIPPGGVLHNDNER